MILPDYPDSFTRQEQHEAYELRRDLAKRAAEKGFIRGSLHVAFVIAVVIAWWMLFVALPIVFVVFGTLWMIRSVLRVLGAS